MQGLEEDMQVLIEDIQISKGMEGSKGMLVPKNLQEFEFVKDQVFVHAIKTLHLQETKRKVENGSFKHGDVEVQCKLDKVQRMLVEEGGSKEQLMSQRSQEDYKLSPNLTSKRLTYLQEHYPKEELVIEKKGMQVGVPEQKLTNLKGDFDPEFAKFQSLILSQAKMLNSPSLDLRNERYSNQIEQYAKMDVWEQGDERKLKKQYDDKQKYDQLQEHVHCASIPIQPMMDIVGKEYVQDEPHENELEDKVQNTVAVEEHEEAKTQQSTSNQIFNIEDDILPADKVKSTNEVVQVLKDVKVGETVKILKEVEVVGEKANKKGNSQGFDKEESQKGAEAKGPSEHERSNKEDMSTPLDKKSKNPRSEQQVACVEAQAKVEARKEELADARAAKAAAKNRQSHRQWKRPD
ncbi:hypothetical protein L7F22_009036 [Adiantum nelumboides]|nr:hypothetical protein [Adiantum nelumboides]